MKKIEISKEKIINTIKKNKFTIFVMLIVIFRLVVMDFDLNQDGSLDLWNILSNKYSLTNLTRWMVYFSGLIYIFFTSVIERHFYHDKNEKVKKEDKAIKKIAKGLYRVIKGIAFLFLIFILNSVLVLGITTIQSIAKYNSVNRIDRIVERVRDTYIALQENDVEEYLWNKTYDELQKGTYITSWGEPKDFMDATIIEYLGVDGISDISKGYSFVDNPKVYVKMTDDVIYAELRYGKDSVPDRNFFKYSEINKTPQYLFLYDEIINNERNVYRYDHFGQLFDVNAIDMKSSDIYSSSTVDMYSHEGRNKFLHSLDSNVSIWEMYQLYSEIKKDENVHFLNDNVVNNDKSNKKIMIYAISLDESDEEKDVYKCDMIYYESDNEKITCGNSKAEEIAEWIISDVNKINN